MKRIFFLMALSSFFGILGYGTKGNAQNASPNDWPNLAKYAEENKQIDSSVPLLNRVVFMGNSITEFWDKTDKEFFIGKPYINRGISGQTSPQMLLRFRQDVIELKPAVVIILAGINDIAENTGPISLEAIFGNIVSMVELAKVNNIGVVLSSVLPASGFYWNPALKPADKIVSLNEMIRNYALKNNIVYVDYYSKLVDDTKGMKQEYADDGVHPNLAGYRVMGPLAEEGINAAMKADKK